MIADSFDRIATETVHDHGGREGLCRRGPEWGTLLVDGPAGSVARPGGLAAMVGAVWLGAGRAGGAGGVSRAPAVFLSSESAGPDPLAHAPRFRRALGQQMLAQPAGVAVDPAGGVWVADTGHDR